MFEDILKGLPDKTSPDPELFPFIRLSEYPLVLVFLAVMESTNG